MAGFYSDVERVIRDIGDRGLDIVLFYYGIELEVWRDVKRDAYTEIHNTNSGGAQDKIKCIEGVLVSDDFFPNTGISDPSFTGGFLICREKDIMSGDEIRIISEDCARRAFKVNKRVTRGQTKNVFTQYEITAIVN